MPWVEQRDGDIRIPPGQVWEFRHEGGARALGLLPEQPFVGAVTKAENAGAHVLKHLRFAYERRGECKVLVVYYDDLKQQFVTTVKALDDTTLRILRQPEHPQIYLPDQYGGGTVELWLKRTRLLVGEATPDPLAQGQDKIAVRVGEAAATVGKLTDKIAEGATSLTKDVADSARAIVKSVPLVILGAVAIALVIFWPKIKAVT